MDIGDFFANPSSWGIGLALLMGVLWLAVLAPPWRKNPRIWAAYIGGIIIGALLFAPSIAWIQVPLQTWTNNLLIQSVGQQAFQSGILLYGIPSILLTGLVQEAAKLVPPLLYVVLCLLLWHRHTKPKTALMIGAMTGAGFGIFEAQWVLNQVFAVGWSWQTVQLLGPVALLSFVERFFTVAFHTSCTALAAYGLAKGKGWQFYLMVALFHSLTNYGAVFYSTGFLTAVQIEVYLAVWSLALMAVVLWLRWHRLPEAVEPELSLQEES